MSIEENKAIVRRIFDEAWNGRDFSGLGDLIAASYVERGAPPGVALPPGPEGVRALLGMFHQAFPDLHITVDDILGEGDRVAVRTTARGTHQGALGALPATGKQVAVPAILFFRIAGGKVVDRWEVFDQMGMMQQLGVLPAAP
jgi:steroid delta-isomerase-like uncharacterized protein